MRACSLTRWVILLAAILAVAWPVPAQTSQPAAFSILHVSDIHVDAHLARTGPPGALRGGETIRWICEEAARPQEITDADGSVAWTAPPPAAAIATGDLTEYGVIDDTWQVFEKAFEPLPCKLYVLPGNHDNTWVAMYDVLRRRHGGENHSFDLGGCHFACISSASPQEPVPCVDARTRAWLKADLERLPPGTPVFVALHHPLYSDEFANPAERELLVDLLRDYNVVLLLYGHGHGVDVRDNGGVFGAMGGSTFGKNAGYGLLTVADGRVRYAYRYHRDPQAQEGTGGPRWKVLHDRPLPKQATPRLFTFAEPAADGVVATGPLPVRLAPSSDLPAGSTLAWRIDRAAPEERPAADGLDFTLDAAALVPGTHLLSVTLSRPDGASDTRTRIFHVEGGGVRTLWRRQLPAAFKAGPVLMGEHVILAGNDGMVRALAVADGTETWTFATGGEILGTPAAAGDRLIFGSGDGRVYAVSAAGQQEWMFAAGRPVYGSPLVADGIVYVGDNGGRLHALELNDGKPRWTFARADFPIECRPEIWGELVTFGAWDGYLYALDRETGVLRWKVPGPKAKETNNNRYYAPADCGPVARGDALLVCDRGYLLGTFAVDGAAGPTWPLKVAGIAAAGEPDVLYARTIEDRVMKLDRGGQPVWEAGVPAGRFPVPPTPHADTVYVCSNRGLLSVLGAADGQVRWQYQATPGLYVMAPVAVATDGSCVVAGMDGTVVAVRPPR